MTLHDEAIHWVKERVGGRKVHHNRTVRYAGLIPDVIVEERDKLQQIHEVETIPLDTIKLFHYAKKKKQKPRQVLWLVLNSFVLNAYHTIRVIVKDNDGFQMVKESTIESPLTYKQLIRDKKELMEEIKNLKKMRKNLKHIKLFYQLPLFEFKSLLNSDECLLCSNKSDLIIDADKIGKYGLCFFCFEKLLKLEYRGT